MSNRINDIRKLRPTSELYIALADLDFSFYPDEMEKVIESWRAGVEIAEIAQSLNREIDEIAILIMDLARKNKVEKRRGGVFGN